MGFGARDLGFGGSEAGLRGWAPGGVLGFWEHGVSGFGFRVYGLGFGVQGLGFRVQGLGFRV